MPKYYCKYCNFRTVRENTLLLHLKEKHNYQKNNNKYKLPNKKQKINEIDLIDFLNNYKNKEIIYIPNPGNAGDCLIALGTFNIFKKVGLNFSFGSCNKKYKNKILFYAGGGNLVGIYYNCKRFLQNNLSSNEIIILPHTIKDEDIFIQTFNDNIKIICREKMSYYNVYKNIKNKNNVFLSKDTAFYINNLEKYKNIETLDLCNCFRTDDEKTNILIPKNNYDLSLIKNGVPWIDNDELENTKNKIFDYLSKYKKIYTNRLHIAIAGYLINKEVHFYPNIYYKNEAVYDYSLKNDENIHFYKSNSEINILVVFLSCSKNKKIWNKIKLLELKNYLIFSGKKMDKDFELIDNILYLNCNDLYDGLPEKIICCINAILNIDKYKNITHILKIDDHDNKISKSTIDLLKNKFKNVLNNYDYIGQKINKGGNGRRRWHFKKLSHHSNWYRKEYKGNFVDWLDGGCSYILSRKSMNYINSIYNLNNLETLRKNDIYEDLMIAKVLTKFSIKPHQIFYGVIGDK